MATPQFAPTEEMIPFERLKRPDPILLFDEIVLYEDELADNGIAILSVKVRVHPERLFVLSRFYLRLDGVLVRVRDTRVFVEFATGEVLREYQAREETYANVRNVSFPLSFFFSLLSAGCGGRGWGSCVGGADALRGGRKCMGARRRRCRG